MNEAYLNFHDIDGRFLSRVLIVADKPNTLFVLTKAESLEHGEEPLQLLENATYEYRVDSPNFGLQESAVIIRSKLSGDGDVGRLVPQSYTGLLPLALVQNNERNETVATAFVEIRSRKLNYRADYRLMLNAIANRCTDLLLDLRAPTQARFLPDPQRYQDSLPQRFAFIRSILTSREFLESIGLILQRPYTTAKTEDNELEINKGFKPNNNVLRQIAARNPRIRIPHTHPLNRGLHSQGKDSPTIPRRVTVDNHSESVDNLENRFIKHTLVTYSDLLAKVGNIAKQQQESASNTRLRIEAAQLSEAINALLSRNLFKEVSRLTTFSLSSPVLQKRAGYRELLQIWIKFNLASDLTWAGGEDVYGSGKRNMDVLYEYWLYFELLEIVSRVFSLPPRIYRELIEPRPDSLGVKLRSGKMLVIDESVSINGTRLRVRFSYNRTFQHSDRPDIEGSWTVPMRPDFTLSAFPADLSVKEAEATEKMVHLHFDAKYRADNIEQLFGSEEEPPADDTLSQKSANQVKHADLLKMHSYRDAIKRSYGAYVLYPGSENKDWRHYTEILPGLGAFAMRPVENGRASGSQLLHFFLQDIVSHLTNRITKRAQLADHRFEVYRH